VFGCSTIDADACACNSSAVLVDNAYRGSLGHSCVAHEQHCDNSQEFFEQAIHHWMLPRFDDGGPISFFEKWLSQRNLNQDCCTVSLRRTQITSRRLPPHFEGTKNLSAGTIDKQGWSLASHSD
jgi:hypothetical protein